MSCRALGETKQGFLQVRPLLHALSNFQLYDSCRRTEPRTAAARVRADSVRSQARLRGLKGLHVYCQEWRRRGGYFDRLGGERTPAMVGLLVGDL